MPISTVPATGTQPLTIVVSGNFEFGEHEAFRACYRALPPGTPVVVDLSAARYMDSSALGMLLLLRRHAGETPASVRLVDVPPAIRRILDIARFDTLFHIR